MLPKERLADMLENTIIDKMIHFLCTLQSVRECILAYSAESFFCELLIKLWTICKKLS
jgi:hypothetical protein